MKANQFFVGRSFHHQERQAIPVIVKTSLCDGEHTAGDLRR